MLTLLIVCAGLSASLTEARVGAKCVTKTIGLVDETVVGNIAVASIDPDAYNVLMGQLSEAISEIRTYDPSAASEIEQAWGGRIRIVPSS